MAFLETDHADLSKRELEILCLLAERLSDREIAERLVLTVNTVKWYNRQIYSILGVSSRRQAIARARELNLLDGGSEPSRAFAADSAYRLHHFPAETTRFIGRARDVEAIKRLLATAHLLTLVGPPGTGKTRLALKVARDLPDAFRNGVYFVSLAPIRDPAHVVEAIASAIGIKESPRQPLIDLLKQTLHDKQMLLLLDNFEHVLPAATQLSALLAAAPHVKVLATSREPLHLYGEQEYGVLPLALPDLTQLDPDILAECESAALFMQRARAVRADFALGSENAALIADICVRLEGLPLAIELAAARMKLLTPQMLLSRLSSRLDTLKGGAHDLPARQQALVDTIEWSYNLLYQDEQRLFAGLSVFRGGCSPEAVEAIFSEALPLNVFDALESLVNKSLLQRTEDSSGELRFMMLDTLREYAWQRLQESGEAGNAHRRHAGYFVQLAEAAEPEMRGAKLAYWIERLASEENNLQAALEWSLGGGDPELGLRLVAALRDFWVMTGRFTQGQHWTQTALSHSDSAPLRLQARVMIAAASIRYVSPQQAQQQPLLQQAVELARAADDRLTLAWALIFLAMSLIGSAADFEEVLSLSEESLLLFQVLDHKPGMVQALNTIGELWRILNEHDRAQAAYEQCLRLVGETGEIRREAMLRFNLGMVAQHRGEIEQAEHLFKQGLAKAVAFGRDKRLIITGIVMLANTIAASGDLERAVRLFGAADALFEPRGAGLNVIDQPEQARTLAWIRSQLDQAHFDRCWHEGCGLSLEQTVSYALDANGAAKH